MANMKDVAIRAKVSLTTVSKYYNGNSVRPETKRKIDKAARELGYKVNEAARILKGGRSSKIGICVPSFELSYCRRIAIGIQDKLESMGFDAPIYDYMYLKERESIFLERMLQKKASGMITIPLDRKNPLYLKLRSEGVPVIAISNTIGSFFDGNLTIDYEDVAETLLQKLEDNGHKRLGILCGRLEYFDMGINCGLTEEALSVHGMELDKDLLYLTGVKPVDYGYDGCKHLLSLKNPPTAIFCFNGEIMLGCRMALLDMGLEIPRDISLCGAVSSAWVQTPVVRNFSCLFQHVDAITQGAVDMVIAAGKTAGDSQKAFSTSVKFKAGFHDGGSIGAARVGIPHK